MNKDLLILQNSRTWSELQAFVHKSISEKFLSVEGSSRCFLDGRPSCPQMTFGQWTTFLCWADLSGSGLLYGRIGDGPIFGSPSIINLVFKIVNFLYVFILCQISYPIRHLYFFFFFIYVLGC